MNQHAGWYPLGTGAVRTDGLRVESDGLMWTVSVPGGFTAEELRGLWAAFIPAFRAPLTEAGLAWAIAGKVCLTFFKTDHPDLYTIVATCQSIVAPRAPAPPEPKDLPARLALAENQIAELLARVAALEAQH